MSQTIATPQPSAGRTQPPIYPLVVGNNGGFMVTRSSPAQGACGVGSYPCKHPGLDVVGKPGTSVRAPEDGTIVMVSSGSGSPFGGYGPWVVVLQGRSGRFHLLAHLDPATASMGQVGQSVTAGDIIGTVSSAWHTHWEVRKRAVPAFASGESNATNNLDPIQWLTDQESFGGMKSMLLLGAAAALFYLVWTR